VRLLARDSYRLTFNLNSLIIAVNWHYCVYVTVKRSRSCPKVRGQRSKPRWVGTRQRRVEWCQCCASLSRSFSVKSSLGTSLIHSLLSETPITCCLTSWLLLLDLHQSGYDNYNCSSSCSSDSSKKLAARLFKSWATCLTCQTRLAYRTSLALHWLSSTKQNSWVTKIFSSACYINIHINSLYVS